jgi:hypothetical protein
MPLGHLSERPGPPTQIDRVDLALPRSWQSCPWPYTKALNSSTPPLVRASAPPGRLRNIAPTPATRCGSHKAQKKRGRKAPTRNLKLLREMAAAGQAIRPLRFAGEADQIGATRECWPNLTSTIANSVRSHCHSSQPHSAQIPCRPPQRIGRGRTQNRFRAIIDAISGWPGNRITGTRRRSLKSLQESRL